MLKIWWGIGGAELDKLSLFSKPARSDNGGGIKLCWFIAVGISITALDTRGEKEEEKSVERGMMKKKEEERHLDKFSVLYVLHYNIWVTFGI